MNAYEQFKEKVSRLVISQTTDVPCPNCGGDLDYAGMPDEAYMADDTFERAEILRCGSCELEIEVVQVYTPTKCYVAEFNDMWCVKEEE